MDRTSDTWKRERESNKETEAEGKKRGASRCHERALLCPGCGCPSSFLHSLQVNILVVCENSEPYGGRALTPLADKLLVGAKSL